MKRTIEVRSSEEKRRQVAALQNRWWHGREWTLAMCLAMLLFNLGLFAGSPNWAGRLVTALQYDRTAVLNGEVWRIITGNMVHWSPEHFALDVSVFLVVGFLFEPMIHRAYPWLIFASALAVGVAVFLFQPELTVYRGLSGVDSGQFAAALGIECLVACREKRRWLWAAPATAIFLAKIVYECTSGRLFFDTESLGSIGLPVPMAHAAGVSAVMGLVVICLWMKRSEFQVQRESQDKEIALWRW